MEDTPNTSTYKEELLDDIALYASDNKEEVKEWLTENDGDPEGIIDHINGIADQLTGNDDGSYYCNAYKAKLAIERNNLLTDEEFLGYLRDTDTHLEDIMEKGWEAVDIWGRCFVLDYKLTDEEIAEALIRGLHA